MTRFWKTNQNITLDLFYFIGPANPTLMHYPFTVALPGLADWSVYDSGPHRGHYIGDIGLKLTPVVVRYHLGPLGVSMFIGGSS